MLENVSLYLLVFFVLTIFCALALFYRALIRSSSQIIRNRSGMIVIACLLWIIFQSVLSLQNVYSSETNTLPPRIFVFGVLPSLILIIALFVSAKGRQFIDSLPLFDVTLIHTIRIPVEYALYCLFIYKTIPQLMTFEGRNFDIIAGITAPFIAYFGIKKGKLSRSLLIIWNFICIGLLFNVVIHGILSVPSPFQKFAFEQPNIAVLYFPFSCLVSFIVPLVFFAHLITLRKLLIGQKIL